MEPPPPAARPRRRSRRRRWLAGGMLLLPVALFALSNGTLATSWARGKISSAISSRIRLETRITHASWSPWNGLTLRGLEIRQPRELAARVREPLAKIGAIRIMPDWRSLLSGSPKPLSIDLESPRVVLPVQVVAFLASSQSPPALPAPASASLPAEPAPHSPAGAPAQPSVTGPPRAATPPPAPAATKPAPRPTGWFRIHRGSLAIIFAGAAESLAELDGIDGAVPISGDPAESALRIGRILLAGSPLGEDLKIPCRWQDSVIGVPTTELMLHGGARISLAALMGRHGGAPFQIEAAFPRQPLGETSLPAGAVVQADSLGIRLRAAGLLLAPSTWQADFLAESHAVAIRLSGERRIFDRGRVTLQLRHGILSCADARLTSDEVSFLGNGTLLPDGRAAAVVRTVAAPETIHAGITRLLPGVRELPVFTPLSTPQRVALDLNASGTLGNLSFHLGRDGPAIGSNPAPK